MKDMATDNSVDSGQSDAIDWSILDSLRVLQKPGKPDLRKMLMTVYLDSSPALMNSLIAAATAADGQALMQSAHALKSSSVSIGALTFGKTCSEIEQCGRARSLEDVPALAKRAEYEFDAVCSAFRDALEQNG
jgi:HPt (histidine-containing phosphotransfer) domain-containing protein